MKTMMDIKIKISYVTFQNSEVKDIYLKPEEYFDSLEEGENYWDDGIDKFIFPHEYLNISVSSLKWLTIIVSKGKEKRISRCQYLDGDNVTMNHSVDENGEEEIILSAKISEQSYHTTRILKPKSKSWAVYVDSIDSDVQIEGKYNSINLCKNWSFEELKSFSKIWPKNF